MTLRSGNTASNQKINGAIDVFAQTLQGNFAALKFALENARKDIR